jgi:penicillin-binding protein 2
MSNELDQVRDVRPDVPLPTSNARDAAREQLRMAVAREVNAAPRSSAPVASGRTRHRQRRQLGAVLTAATSVAVVVGVGAIVMLSHPRGHQSTGVGHAAEVRGAILDQSGGALAVTRPAVNVLINPARLPGSVQLRADVYGRLAHILGTSTKVTTCPIPGHATQRLANIRCIVAQSQVRHGTAAVTVAVGVSPGARRQIVQSRQLPGVATKRVKERAYPHGDLAAQVIGTVGSIPSNPDPGASAQVSIGQTGLESEYNRFLRAGDNLRTSLNQRLQQAGQRALQEAIDNNPPANGGAFVALNPDNGEVYAMGSLPTFDANIVTKPISAAAYHQLTNPASNFPLINRAIQSAGPTGSTFKPITETAALESGAWNVNDIFDDTGQFCVSGQCRHNSGHAVDGALNLVDALRVSSDDFFYNLGARTNADPTTHPNGGALQRWAHSFGIGEPTGIDLGGEASGNLPSPRWRARVDQLELDCEHGTGPYNGHPRHRSCGIADGRPWSIGDNISLAVGQGDVQVTPLQLAVAYSAIANGGKIVRPHLGLDIENSSGTVLQRIDPPSTRRININPVYLDTIGQGLHDAAQTPGGTSDDVFGNFPETVYGKAGTAQYNGQQDYSWYACFVPATATSKPIAVVVTVEQGGFGAVAASPVAREILSQWFFGNPGKYVAGNSTTL